jgi:PAS domain S-box-containing protein
MSISLKVLILEDNEADAELILHQLRRAGFELEWQRVETEPDYLACLRPDLNLILSDYTMPQFEAPRALELLQKSGLDIPFIVITGTISEEAAVNCMKQGAADYLLKDRLARLGEAVKHALQQRQLHREKQQAQIALRESEEKFRAIFHEALDVILVVEGETGQILSVNPATRRILGYEDGQLVGRHFSVLFPAAPEISPTKLLEELWVHGAVFGRQEFLRPDGSICPMDLTATFITWGERQVVLVTLRDVTERKQMELALAEERAQLAQRVEERTAELQMLNAELARAARLKDEFLATMSHELRTPLNAVLGMSEILRDNIYGPLNEAQLGAVRHIEESGRHLLELINDILDLSKIEAGKMELTIGSVAVHDLCQASLRFIQQMAQKKRLTVSAAIDSRVESVQADERRLKQILVNLLTNAVKFTPEGGRIGLEVVGDESKGTLYFTIWDTGIGISQEEIANLFKPFVQIDSGLSRRHEGTGLGLSLVSRLVEMLGGGVSLESEVGRGSRFTVSLPWQPVSALPGAQTSLLAGDASRSSPQASVPVTPLILLVEDNEANILSTRDFLQARGYRIAVARSGLEAIEQAEQIQPHLILMDIQMPHMDGLEATQLIRARPPLARIPIIALTALVMPGDRERCLAAGINEYLSKPVSLNKLVELINQQLKQAA